MRDEKIRQKRIHKLIRLRVHVQQLSTVEDMCVVYIVYAYLGCVHLVI